MPLPEALEMVRRAGSIRIENGKLLVRFPEAERAQLQPALDFLRSHREEALRVLAEPPVPTLLSGEDAPDNVIEPQPPMPAKGLADIDPDQTGMSYGEWQAAQLNAIFAQHGTGGRGALSLPPLKTA